MADTRESWEGLRQNLVDAGCDAVTIAQCIAMAKANEASDLLRLLSVHRSQLLDALHEQQRKIDCLDFLLYQLRKLQTER